MSVRAGASTRYVAGMEAPAIIVVHNHLPDPGEHRSLLLVRYGTLTIEVTRCDDRYSVHAMRSKPPRGEWCERAVDAEGVEDARQIARRLVRELRP